MRLFARTLRRLWARPLKASCGHGMDAFTEGGATRTRPPDLLPAPLRLCSAATADSARYTCDLLLLHLLFYLILLVISLSALGYANEPMFNLWPQQQQQKILPMSIALTFVEGHSFKRACSALSILSLSSIPLLILCICSCLLYYSNVLDSDKSCCIFNVFKPQLTLGATISVDHSWPAASRSNLVLKVLELRIPLTVRWVW